MKSDTLTILPPTKSREPVPDQMTSHLWYSERKVLELLRREIRDIVRIQNSQESDEDNKSEGDEAHTVVDSRDKKGKQKYPENGIIRLSDDSERVGGRLFDQIGVF